MSISRIDLLGVHGALREEVGLPYPLWDRQILDILEATKELVLFTLEEAPVSPEQAAHETKR